MRLNLRVVLICISLIARDVEHFFIDLVINGMSSSVKSLLSSLAHLLIGLFVVLVLNFLSSLYILEISALSDVCVVKIFSHSVASLCMLLFALLRKSLSFNPSHLLILDFISCALGVL